MQLTSPQTNLFLLLFLATILHSFFLTSLLLSKAGKERGMAWLSVVLLAIGLMMFSYVLYLGHWMEEWPHLLGVLAPFVYLIGPAYFFFIKRSTNKEYRLKWWDSLHLFPFIFIATQWIPVYVMSSEAKLQLIEQIYEKREVPLSYLLLSNMHFLLIMGYAVTSLLFLRQGSALKEAGEYRGRWLTHFTQLFILFLGLTIGVQVVFWSLHWDGAIMELSLVLVFAIGIHLLGHHVLGRDHIMPAFKVAKYTHSPLSKSAIHRYQKNILEHLDQNKPWLDAHFSLNDLSQALNIPRHHISQVLNEGIQLSFNDLVSQYRIEHFKERLMAGEADQFSILGIALDCGFGSKSSFNRAFKKITGTTPTNWLDRLSTPETDH